jgi:hypothetical protein
MKRRITCNDVGWCLLVTVKRIDEWNAKQPKRTKMNPPLRFSKYETLSSVHKQTWKKSVSVCVAILRECHLQHTVKPTMAHYNAAHRKIEAQIPRVGELRSNHWMGILSALGFLPLSWFPMIYGGAKKAYAHLERTYPNSVPGKDECMSNVCYLLEWKLGRRVSLRYSENTLCKCGRIWAGSDDQYWDLDPRFPLFSVQQKNITLIHHHGVKRIVEQFFSFENGTTTTHMSYNTNCPRRIWMKLFV